MIIMNESRFILSNHSFSKKQEKGNYIILNESNLKLIRGGRDIGPLEEFDTETGLKNPSQKQIRYNEWDIYSIKGGEVVHVYTKDSGSAYGNNIIIKDNEGNYVRYAHLEAVNVVKGQKIKQGDIIGIMGNTGTGDTKNPNDKEYNRHLHVSVYPPTKNRKERQNFRSSEATINPAQYILDGGTYPCNTKVSGKYKKKYPGIINKTDIIPWYLHEGLDFSGRPTNLIPGWKYGIYATGYLDNAKEYEYLDSLKREKEITAKSMYNNAVISTETTALLLGLDLPKNYKDKIKKSVGISLAEISETERKRFIKLYEAQERAKAEAEAKRIAEEKAAKEKAEKERQDKEKLAREDEERRRKEGGNNPSHNPKKPDEGRSEPILDEDDRPGRRNKKGEKPIKSLPKNDGGNKTTQPTIGSGGSSGSSAVTQPSQGGGSGGSGGTSKKTEGGGGGSKPKPPKQPGGGGGRTIYTPCSLDTGNEYYLGSLYGTKPFSAQESSAFNSTIISNELSALQPITSLNVAGLPVNDTAIKEDPFGV